MSNELPQLPSKQRKVLLAREVESGTGFLKLM
jgi:hypothetical protein